MNARQLTRIGALLLTTSLALACSDDKPAAADSSGSENPKDRVAEAHEDFKEGVQPAAGWVDEKSHRAADELNTAARKVKGAFEDDEAPPASDAPKQVAPASAK